MIIPNFPEDLADLHHAWHDPGAHPGLPTRQHPAGTDLGGLEFLVFHRDFINKVHIWYNSQPGADPNLLAPTWTKIPPELKVSPIIMPNGTDVSWNQEWASVEHRLTHRASDDPDMVNAGRLGTFIELGIHNQFLHNASSVIYNERVVASLHSPQSTWFYKIHGLVQFWWDLWNLSNRMKWLPPGIQKILEDATTP